MTTVHSILAFLVLLISSAYSKDSISCPFNHLYEIEGYPDSFDVKGTVDVSYSRNSLSVYSYNDTKYVNFYLTDVKVSVKGTYSKETSNDRNILGNHWINIEGTAEFGKNDNDDKLINGKVYLKGKLTLRNNLHGLLQEKIVAGLETCIASKLCDLVGTVTEDDYNRAKKQDHDFGKNSVLNQAFHDKYPLLDSSNTDKTEKAELQTSLNLLVDFLLASVATKISGKELGKYDLPDHDISLPVGYYSLKNSKFGDLTTLKRLSDIKISNEGLEFAVDAKFGLGKAIIDSDYKYKAVGLGLYSGDVEITLDNVQCVIKASINYNKRPCVTVLHNLSLQLGKLDFKMGGHFWDGPLNYGINTAASMAIPIYGKFVQNLLQSKIKDVVNDFMGKIDCENYRP